MTPRQQAEAGAKGYTRLGLALYDPLVLGLNTNYTWKCPNRRIVELYDEHVSCNHLDVGVGTGYFLDRCRFPPGQIRLGLMDLNPNCIEKAAQRLARLRPETYLANVLEPLDIAAEPFDSVGLTYLLHCLPGTLATKAEAFRHLKAFMKPGATLFGATVLQGDVTHSWFARRMLAKLNGKGIFSNTEDDLKGLRRSLEQHFPESVVQTVGAVGVFWARL